MIRAAAVVIAGRRVVPTLVCIPSVVSKDDRFSNKKNSDDHFI